MTVSFEQLTPRKAHRWHLPLNADFAGTQRISRFAQLVQGLPGVTVLVTRAAMLDCASFPEVEDASVFVATGSWPADGGAVTEGGSKERS